jgi:hypothetical protein
MGRRGSQVPTMLVLAVVLMLAGCGSDQPKATMPGAQADNMSAPSPQLLPGAQSIPSAPLGTGGQSGQSGSLSVKLKAKEGGTISTGNFSVQIPANALDSDATVTLTCIDPEQVIVRLTPSGERLSKPAVIRWSSLDSWVNHRRYANLLILRRDGRDLTPIPCVRGADDVQAQMDTFGEFALGGRAAGSQEIEFLHYLSGPGYTTRYITVALGGEVQYDRYKVSIPSGALSADTYITVRDSGTIYVMCDLEPHGIQFRVPVRFEINLIGLAWQPYTDWTDYWLNPETGLWERQDGTFAGAIIVDYLDHFSRYAAGRAGW